MAHEALVRQVLEALRSLDPFPVPDFMARLFNLARGAPDIAAVKSALPVQQHTAAYVGSAVLDTPTLNRLAVEAVVTAIAQLNSNADRAGFKSCIKEVEASKGTFADMTQITALLLAQYIDAALASQGLPSLAELQATAGFATAFTTHVTSAKFIGIAVAADLSSGHRMYSTAMVFTCAYLDHDGPGAFVPQPESAFGSSAAARVVEAWARVLLDEDKAPAAVIFQFCSQMASVAVAPEYDADPVAAEKSVRRAVMRKVFRPALGKSAQRKGELGSDEDFDDLVEDAAAEFRGFVTRCQVGWQTLEGVWFDPVSAMATKATQTSRTFETGGTGSAFSSFNPPTRKRKWQEVTTTTGRALADWLEKAKKSQPDYFFSGRSPPDVVVVQKFEVPLSSGGSCFRPGTVVATKAGHDVAIECLEEGTTLLTHAVGERFGICSDEDVTVRVADPYLVGFNDEGVFATPGHVFHTTTGLRAVDPELALAENAWLDVGRLQAGHILLRLTADRKSYDLVPIDSIQVELVPSVKTVHGVHFREGERSYHANGFLVAVNYPEITIRSVAAALAKLSAGDRVRALSRLADLRPVFAKIGLAGVDDLLRRELADAKAGRLRARRGPHVPRFREMRRSLALTEAQGSLVETRRPPFAYTLPAVEIFDGVLLLDGAAVPRTALEPAKSSIRWSRPLSTADGFYEHGILVFSADGLDATGAVLLSDDANPAELSPGQDFVVSFFAEAPVPRLDHPSPKTAPRAVTEKVHSFAARTAPAKPVAKLQDAPAVVQRSSVPTIPGIPIPPVSVPVPPVSVPPRPENVAPPATTHNDVANPSELDEGFTAAVFDPQFNITLQVDQEQWPANVDRVSCINPTQFGTLGLGVYHSSHNPQEAVKLSAIILPELDQLLEVYNGQAPPELQLPRLYRSVVRHDRETGGFKVEVQITAAPFIASLSDQFQPVDNPLDIVYPTKNLTFANQLGTDITLPLLFSEAEFDVDMFFEVASGAIWEYDPAMVGSLGHRYFFEGSWIFARSARSSQARTDKRVQISREAAFDSSLGVSAPSPATASISRAAVLAQNQLNDLFVKPYDAEEHQNNTRAMFEKLMYYFMEDDDRNNFTTKTKPKEAEFSPSLLASLNNRHRNWLTQTYCKAFVSFSISRINKAVEDGDGSNENPGFQFKLTPEQKDKIWYFWSGNGETCLASSKEFNEINERVSLYVLRDMFGPDFATTYLANGAGPGWADLMVAKVPKYIPTEAAKEFNGENVLHKWCTIAHCLAPAGVSEQEDIDPDAEVDMETALSRLDHSTQIFNAVMDYITAEENQDVINSAGDMMRNYALEQWIQDAIGALIDEVYDGTSPLDQEVRDELLADFDALRQEFGIEANATVEEFKQAALNTTAAMSAHMAAALATLPALFNVGLFQGIHNVVNYVFRTSSGVTPGVANGLYGTMMIGILTFWIFSLASGEPIDFGSMPADQKASFVLLNMRTVTGLLQGVMAQFKASKVAGIGIAAANTALDDLWKAKATNRAFRHNNMYELRDIADNQPPTRMTQRLVESFEDDIINHHINDTKQKAQFHKNNRNKIWRVNREARETAWGSLASESDNAKIPKTQGTFKWIARFGLMISIAAFFAFSVILVRDIRSGNLTAKGRTLARAQIAVMALAVAVEFGALFLTAGLLAMALPFVGVILAIVGIVLAVLFGREDARVPPKPEPSPAEIFIRDEAIPFADGLAAPPAPMLTYTLSLNPDSGFQVGKKRTVRIQGKNLTGQPVSIATSTLTFSSGGDDVCVFSEPAFTNEGMLGLGVASAVEPGEMAVERLAGTDGPVVHNLISDVFSTHVAYQAIIEPAVPPESKLAIVATEGIEIENSVLEDGVEILSTTEDNAIAEPPIEPPYDAEGDPMIVIPPNGGFTWVIHGTVNPIQDNGPGESWFEVTELRTDGDKTLTRFFVQRS